MDIENNAVGKMYHNTLTKKIGVVESWESKYRTYLMRDVDGRTFNIGSSSFKKDWEPYTGDEVIQTSQQIQDEYDKLEEDANKSLQTLKDMVLARAGDRSRINEKSDDSELVVYGRNVKNILDNLCRQYELIPTYPKLHTDMNDKGDVRLLNTKYIVISMWVKPVKGTVFIAVKDDLWKEVVFDEDLGDMKCTYHDSWNVPYVIERPIDQVERLLRNYVQAFKRIKEKYDSKEE